MTARKTVGAFHYDGTAFAATDVALIQEIPFTIHLNGREFITLLCYPDHLDELAAGFLRSEGLIASRDDIVTLKVGRDGRSVRVDARIDEIDNRLHERRVVTTGCGKGSVFYFALDSLKAKPAPEGRTWGYAEIIGRMGEINRSKGTNNLAGLHVCGLCDGGQMVVREDIGRHNALDKIAGYCLLNGISTTDAAVFTTGRISSEMLIKSAKLGASVVVSRSTPTDLAYDIAVKLNITLVGYVRGERMTVYTADGRIIR